MFPNVQTRHLHAVVVLAEELNFTRAAHRLHLTQSAVSKQITEIEEQHRFRLFCRDKKRNVELTDVGRIFVDRIGAVAVVLEGVYQPQRHADLIWEAVKRARERDELEVKSRK